MTEKTESTPMSISPADVMAQADYYEASPGGFDCYSWSESPPEVKNAKCTQVHLHIHVGALGRILMHFKSPKTLDRLIAALQAHRQDVWGAK